MKKSLVAFLFLAIFLLYFIPLKAQEVALEPDEARYLRQWKNVLIGVLVTTKEMALQAKDMGELKEILSAPRKEPDPRLAIASKVLPTTPREVTNMRVNISKMKSILQKYPDQPLTERESNELKVMVRQEIERFGERATIDLIKICQETREEDIRLNATIALAKAKARNPEVSRTLLILLKDANPGVRYWAIKGLGWVKEIRAVEPLLEILKGNDEVLKDVAVWALGEIGDRRAVSPLMDIFLAPLPTEVKVPETARVLEFKIRVAEALRKLTGQSFGYIEAADEKKRKEALDAWRSWWEKNRRHFG